MFDSRHSNIDLSLRGFTFLNRRRNTSSIYTIFYGQRNTNSDSY